MKLRAISTFTLLSAVVGTIGACSEESGSPPAAMGSLGNPAGSAGKGGGGGAGGSTGGGVAVTGGVASGGTATGGVSTGGVATGGAASGGTGTATGGATNGGASAGTGPGGGNGSSGMGGNPSKGGGGGMSGSSTGGAATGGIRNEPHPEPITNGQNAWASRYWDCCKPACGWKGNVRTGTPMTSCSKENQKLSGHDDKNACENGGSAFMCWSGAPWAVSDKLSYGYAAASGGNYVCGRCYQVQFTGSGHNGSNPGAQSLNGKTMIVQVINNGGVAADQFDLLIPGGGVGLLNACSNQWGTSDLGAQYGGFLAGCNGDKNCVKNKCMQVFNGKPELMAGCDWFLNWFNAADNPNFTFKQIACPQSILEHSGLGDPG
jgi:hypothetical protein